MQKLEKQIISREPQKILDDSLLYFNIDMLEIKAPFLKDYISSEGMIDRKKFKSEKTAEYHFFMDDYGLFLSVLNETNSCFGNMILMGQKFSYKEVKAKGYIQAILFEFVANGEDIVPAFTLLFGEGGFGDTDFSKVSFKGSFFSAEKIGLLPFTIRDFYLKYFSFFTEVSRVDICSDYSANKQEFLTIFDKAKKWTSSIGDDEKFPGLFQTYYMGQVSRDRNHTRVIRIYDKQVDSWKKQKMYLYPHLLDNLDVQRLEVELRSEKLKRIDISALDFLDDIEISKRLFENELVSISSLFEKYKFPRVIIPRVSLVHTYGLPIARKFLKQYCSFIAKIFHSYSYVGLCQLILQPLPVAKKIKKINGEFHEITNGQAILGNFPGEKRYKTDILETAIDPLSFLDTYIKYLHTEIHIPISAINKTLTRNYIKHNKIKPNFHEREEKRVMIQIEKEYKEMQDVFKYQKNNVRVIKKASPLSR